MSNAITRNVEAAQLADLKFDEFAKEAAAMFNGWSNIPPRYLERFAECLADMMPKLKDKSIVDRTPMSEAEAAEFSRKQLTYGVHVGKLIGDVPTDYLCFIADETRAVEMGRFLRSSYVQRIRGYYHYDTVSFDDIEH